MAIRHQQLIATIIIFLLQLFFFFFFFRCFPLGFLPFFRRKMLAYIIYHISPYDDGWSTLRISSSCCTLSGDTTTLEYVIINLINLINSDPQQYLETSWLDLTGPVRFWTLNTTWPDPLVGSWPTNSPGSSQWGILKPGQRSDRSFQESSFCLDRTYVRTYLHHQQYAHTRMYNLG